MSEAMKNLKHPVFTQLLFEILHFVQYDNIDNLTANIQAVILMSRAKKNLRRFITANFCFKYFPAYVPSAGKTLFSMTKE